MSDNPQDSLFLTPQESPIGLSTEQRNFSVGFLKKNTLLQLKKIAFPPITINKLVNNHVPVRIERKIGKELGFIDLDYADMGADIEDTRELIIEHTNILVQLAPFTADELSQLEDNQIIISSSNVQDITPDDIRIMQEKKITALSLNFVKNVEGGNLMEDIIRNESSAQSCGAIGELVISLILPIIFNNNLRYAVQTAPTLLNAIYCYKGKLAHAEIAQRNNLPFTDLLMLCWDWN